MIPVKTTVVQLINQSCCVERLYIPVHVYTGFEHLYISHLITFKYFLTTQKIGFKSDIIIAHSLANVQINTCDKYVTSHHEQILVIDSFCLPHKNWQTSFSANVFAT